MVKWVFVNGVAQKDQLREKSKGEEVVNYSGRRRKCQGTQRNPSSHLVLSSQASGELRDILLPLISVFIPVICLSDINRTS